MCITIFSFNTYLTCKTENGNHDMISALDISDSQVKKKKRRSLRKSIKESSSDKPSKELWKCNFCQKVFRLHNVKVSL